MEMPRHVVSVEQFDRATLFLLFERAEALRHCTAEALASRLRHKVMATLFYEPSTRTRLSFEAAMVRLGGQVISAEYAAATSSAAKGESIEDTARIISGYADVLVIRHPQAGAAARAASVATIPVINAGDGANEHPTQALLDLYTIWREHGRLDHLRIAFVGDLRYGRTVHSLARLLRHCQDIEVFLCAPSVARLDTELIAELITAGLNVQECDDLLALAPTLDVVYQTRVQRERYQTQAEYEQARSRFILDETFLDAFNPRGIILHPLPRNEEIAPSVDRDPRAAYFRQAHNGLFLRMALLEWVFNLLHADLTTSDGSAWTIR
ncbi:aspartate carbamoyltransferase [Thermorudis peleae]|uniref:aspartate carbamoyltransferase n=1 Tax=Thermorudis peleae TaxID=1382356 RepID=UPI000ADB910B